MTPAQRLHEAACGVLGLDPDAHGSQAAVARKLGCSRAQYANVLSGADSVSIALLSRWAGRLGLRTIIEPDGSVIYETGRRDSRRTA